MLIIPFTDDSQFKEQIQLTGVLFFLTFTWNALNQFWTMQISDSNEKVLIASIKLVPDYPLLAQYTVEGMPTGEIICQNIVKTPDDVKRFDIGQKFLLVYYEPNEIETIINV